MREPVAIFYCFAVAYFAVYGVFERLHALCGWFLKVTGASIDQD